ncbi:hypothetical protein [Streptomyces sp. SID2888]|uniref:hypothetical protein n=1 Tax=Streptomyces sp. SID2888 TaxID=2690256 RepID=UPI001369EB5B|nr:hypothetical protein [Streptomyces sp. SID2888]MYV47895.1 hypothetical protein [Streptomyces sp. SID2888]
MNTSRVAIEKEGTVADIWVLTQPTDGSKKRGFIRADVITSVSGDTDGVLAVRSDTQDLVSLAAAVTPAGNRKPLPAGFHVHFLQTLDEIQRDNSVLAKAVMARWVINQEEWQWAVEDIEDLAPRDF